MLTPLHEASLSQFGRDEYTSDRKYYKVNLMLTEVPSGIPADAVEVHIERNNISRVEANAFSQLSLCQVLDLTGNEISVVELSAFDGLTSLTDLWLSRNQIPEIKPGTFDGLTGLIMLDLSWNRLERLYVNMFANLENIKLLRISGNQISEIEQESFCGLRNLVELHLSENKLSILRADMFQGLVALTELYISYNRIKSVQYNTNMEPFIELTYLQAIDLEGNHLEHLPADVFRHLSRPLTLGVESNPLKCDADLCWLKEEELQGGTEWYRGHARYHESKPACNGDKNWDLWNCNDTAGDISFFNFCGSLIRLFWTSVLDFKDRMAPSLA